MRHLALLSALILLVAAPAAAATAKIAFRGQARVQGAEMSLGELAALSGRCSSLADLPMGRAPEPGRAVVLDRLQLLNRLAVMVPRGAAQVSCPERVVVQRRHQVVTRDQMIEALEEQIARRLGAAAGEVHAAEFKVTEEPMVPAGKLSLDYELPEASGRCLGNVSLPLLIKVDGAVARRLHPAARVSLRRQLVCAAREIGRHDIIGPADVCLATREVCDLEPLLSLEQACGKRATRRIGAGSVLARSDLEEPLTLSRGDAVTIILQSGPLTISTLGTVRENGRVGDLVRVLNTDTKREVMAVVTDSATVRVPFGGAPR